MSKEKKQNITIKQRVIFFAGLLLFLSGASILGFFGIRKIVRMVNKEKLLRENIVLEIPDLRIKAPVLEGVGQDVLKKGVGHFPDTGTPGSGNFCIAGHSSTLYKEYFNRLHEIETGAEIDLYDKEKQCFRYSVSETFIVEPNEVWILDDFGDDRLTLVTCTDDGSQRLIVVAKAEEQIKTQERR